MEKLVFSFGDNKKKTTRKRKKVVLIHHPKIEGRKEYYTSINSDGNEEIFDINSYNVIRKSASSTVASKTIVDKVDLNFVDSKAGSDYKEPYFTYNGEVFKDKIEYDESTNTYYGFINKLYMFDQKIQLFKEE